MAISAADKPKPFRHGVWKRKGGQWCAYWQRHLHTQNEQLLFGLRKNGTEYIGLRKNITKYIGFTSWSKAQDKAREWDTWFAAILELPEAERVRLIKLGGPEGLKRHVGVLAEIVSLGEQAREWAAKIDPRAPSSWTPSELALMKSDGMIEHAWERADRAEHQSDNAIALKVLPPNTDQGDSEFSIYPGLWNTWIRNKSPKRTRKHEATAKLLQEIIGKRDYRYVEEADIRKFRDKLETELADAPNSQIKHMEHVKAIYGAAVAEGLISEDDNPAKGTDVRKHVRELAKTRKAKGYERQFSGEQCKLILDMAAETRLGGTRQEACIWLLRLMCFHGFQPGEASQFQVGDVYMIGTHPVIEVRETCADQGGKHPQKSVKTDSRPRVVPLHPACAAFFDYAKGKGKAGSFIFSEFTWNSETGRAGYLSLMFGAWLRKQCGIVLPKGVKTQYAFRHRYKTLLRRYPEFSADDKAYLGGHGKDISQQYGDLSGGMAYLTPKVARIDPFVDA